MLVDISLALWLIIINTGVLVLLKGLEPEKKNVLAILWGVLVIGLAGLALVVTFTSI